jgi:hypothetical protein
MSIQTTQKFPKLSSESPVNRLKSLSPIQNLNKSRNSASQNSGKLLIIQKSKALNQNSSLASKYFLQDHGKSSTPKNSSISQSLQIGRIKSKRKTSNFENINSWLISEELKLIQSKKSKESLSDLQSEFLLYKEYLNKLVEDFSEHSSDFRSSHQKALEKIVKIFGKVLRRSAQSDSALVPVVQKIEIKNSKILKNSQVQTENKFFLDDDEEFEIFSFLKNLNEKLKNVKLNQIIDKLIDLKQSIVEMDSFVPCESLRPEVSAEAYNRLLKLVVLRSSRGKIDKTMQTEDSSSENREIELNELFNLFHQDQAKLKESESHLEHLTNENLRLILKLQEFETKEKENLEILEKSNFEMTKGMQNYAKSMENLEKALFENMKKLEIIENSWLKVTGSEFNFENIESNLIKISFIRKKSDKISDILGESQELNNRHKNSHEDSKEKEEKKSKLNDFQQVSTTKSLQIIQQGHFSKKISDLDNQFKNCLSENQAAQFEDFKSRHFQIIQNSKLKNLEKNSKKTQANIKKTFSNTKNQLFNEISKKNLMIDHQSIQNEFELISKEPESQIFLSKLLGTIDFSSIPIILKSHLLTLINSHLSKKCGADCSHLRRAMMLKKIHLLAPYPLSKIHL